jgi:DNA-binding MarR family transcriptional regulator
LLRHLNLAPGGRLRRVDLAECLGLTASAVTRALIPLEKIGLVGRESDPRDARVGFAIITPTGSELVVNAETVVNHVSSTLAGSVRAELTSLNAALAQMSGNPGASI